MWGGDVSYPGVFQAEFLVQQAQEVLDGEIADGFQEYANLEASSWGIEGRLILNLNLLQEVVNARLIIGHCQDVALSLRQQSRPPLTSPRFSPPRHLSPIYF